MIFTQTLQFQLFSSHLSGHLEFHKTDHGSETFPGLFVFTIGSREH